MSYAAAVDCLHALGHELAAPPPGAQGIRRKFDLNHMRILARALGDPQTKFPSVLIAGTNGKGSTSATLASILAAAGYRTGLYTSPHLARVNERIRMSSAAGEGLVDIADEDFARHYFQVDEAARRLVERGDLPHPPSFFEVLTALAFVHFAAEGVQIAVLEVGLGGRLDATNIVEPLLSILTDIALDHQDYLGDTIAEITREKAGILRPGGTLVTLPQLPAANQAIGEVAERLQVRGVSATDYIPGRDQDAGVGDPAAPLHLNYYTVQIDGERLEIRSPLAGRHQQRNIALAVAAAVELRSSRSYNIPTAAIEAGVARTVWPGRLEFLPPNVLLDVAHNPAGVDPASGARRTAGGNAADAAVQLPAGQGRTVDHADLFPLFDRTAGRPGDHIVVAPMQNPRAAGADELQQAARRLNIPVHLAEDPATGLALASGLTPTGGLIVITGSIYLVGELRERVLGR